MGTEITVAFITSGASLAVAAISIIINNRILGYKVDELKKQVEKHNNLIDRMYAQESRTDVLEEKVRVANHRIDDLESQHAAQQ